MNIQAKVFLRKILRKMKSSPIKTRPPLYTIGINLFQIIEVEKIQERKPYSCFLFVEYSKETLLGDSRRQQGDSKMGVAVTTETLYQSVVDARGDRGDSKIHKL